MTNPDFIAFSDESSVSGRHRSIAICSLPFEHFVQLDAELRAILAHCDVREFKWQKVRNAKYRFAALKIADCVFKHVFSSGLRVDVLMWDTRDARHTVRRRDDRANFDRMLYHGFHRALTQRDKNAAWHIFSDQRLDVDWGTVNDCLSAIGQRRDYIDTELGVFFGDPNYRIERFDQVESHECPLCQVADLFAGIFVFSIERFDEYRQWRRHHGVNRDLFPGQDQLSGSDKERSVVLEHVAYSQYANRCGFRIYVKERRLRTFNPKAPINFWLYVPQGEYDVAPLKPSSDASN
jgi:hypothetical protein